MKNNFKSFVIFQTISIGANIMFHSLLRIVMEFYLNAFRVSILEFLVSASSSGAWISVL